MRSPPSKSFPRAKAMPAAMLTNKPSKVSVFGDRGINRAMGIISFLTLFFKSSNISIPSCYLLFILYGYILALSFLRNTHKLRYRVSYQLISPFKVLNSSFPIELSAKILYIEESFNDLCRIR
jgi:hypothetical protein